jgi:hypothetical protein
MALQALFYHLITYGKYGLRSGGRKVKGRMLGKRKIKKTKNQKAENFWAEI